MTDLDVLSPNVFDHLDTDQPIKLSLPLRWHVTIIENVYSDPLFTVAITKSCLSDSFLDIFCLLDRQGHCIYSRPGNCASDMDCERTPARSDFQNLEKGCQT